MEWLSILPVALACWIAWMLLYKMFDTSYLFIRKYLFRDRIVECYGVQYDFQPRKFRTTVTVSPVTGKVVGYRYPSSKIGRVSLNQDGTGEYCGRIEWKEV